jgi:hypothetical protein
MHALLLDAARIGIEQLEPRGVMDELATRGISGGPTVA